MSRFPTTPKENESSHAGRGALAGPALPPATRSPPLVLAHRASAPLGQGLGTCCSASWRPWRWAPCLFQGGLGSSCYTTALSFTPKTETLLTLLHQEPGGKALSPKTVAQRPRLRVPPRRIVEQITLNPDPGTCCRADPPSPPRGRRRRLQNRPGAGCTQGRAGRPPGQLAQGPNTSSKAPAVTRADFALRQD